MWNRKEYYQRTREYQLQKVKEWREKNREQHNKITAKSRSKRKFRDPIGYLLSCARIRAQKNRQSFNLERKDIVIPEYCPVLNIPLYFKEGGRIDNTPTVERLVPELDYTKGNVLIISWRANRLRNDATLDELRKIVKFYESLGKQL